MFDEDVLYNTIILFTSDHGNDRRSYWVRKSIPYEGSTLFLLLYMTRVII